MSGGPQGAANVNATLNCHAANAVTVAAAAEFG